MIVLRSVAIALRAACVVGAGTLGAQEPRDTVQLPELVVTATRLPMPLASTTAAVTLFYSR